MRLFTLLLMAPALGAASYDAEAVVERAIAAARAAREAGRALAYGFEHVYERVDGPSGAEIDRYQVEPRGDEHFYRLVERDGDPASPQDLEREERLRRKFRGMFRSDEDVAAGRSGFELDHRLFDRYRFELLPETERAGRPVWAVAFRPREDGEAPVERRIDHALNRLEGVLWIDREDFGLAAAEFRLGEAIEVWGGLLADVERFTGRVDMTRLEPGLWMPSEMELETAGRVLFDSLDRDVRMRWFNFKRISGAGGADRTER